MKLYINDKPREFNVLNITIKDCGKIQLEHNEMVTLVSQSGKACDMTAKEWGFYLAPSLNASLRDQGFKVALVCNNQGKLFLNAVECDKIDLFDRYLCEQRSKLICWLDEWEEIKENCVFKERWQE
jgi:hypothetical protein